MPATPAETPADALRDHAMVRAIKDHALDLGFDLVGVASAEPSRYRDYFRRWLDEGQAGTMTYLDKRFEERSDPRAYLPGAQSIICVGINYFTELDPPPENELGRQGRIARYALGDDYHELIKDRLHSLADWLRETWHCRTRCGVDTVPVMEKELAARAGIGWIGKNTCVINPTIGSWLLLGEILTTLSLPIDEPATDHCGSCTRCIDACPTGAIVGPYQLDARRCISYLTIEHRGEVPPALQAPIGDWLYGCDICQDVCPHNRRVPTASDPTLLPRFKTGSLNVGDILKWTEQDYRAAVKGSAMKRVKLPQLQRNARLVAGNLRRNNAVP
jgi:epoxyqueuosine reductase